MISLGGLVSQRAFGKFEMGKVISNPFANAFIKEGDGEDHEVSMANNSIDIIIKMATELKAKMGEDEKQIPAWIQDHIAKAENLISQASGNYHEYGDSNESVVSEEIKEKDWKTIYNVFVKFLKANTKALEIRVMMRDEDATKKAIKSIISGLTNAQRSLKLESVNEAPQKVGNVNAFGASKVLGKGKKVLGFVADTPNAVATLIQDFPQAMEIEFKQGFFSNGKLLKSIKKGDKVWKELEKRYLDKQTKDAMKASFSINESVNEAQYPSFSDPLEGFPTEYKELLKKLQRSNDSDERTKLINKMNVIRKNIKLKPLTNETVNEASPCWKGYKQVGMKDKGGRQVPNCVPNESVVNEAPNTGEKIQNLNNRIKALKDKMAATKSSEQKNLIQQRLKNALQSLSNYKKQNISKESVSEGVSSADMDKIKGAVEAAKSFMNVGAELKKLGMKYTFATEPLAIYIIQPTPNNKVAIVNKKYVSKPDFVVGDIAVGVMEGKSVTEASGRVPQIFLKTGAVEKKIKELMADRKKAVVPYNTEKDPAKKESLKQILIKLTKQIQGHEKNLIQLRDREEEYIQQMNADAQLDVSAID